MKVFVICDWSGKRPADDMYDENLYVFKRRGDAVWHRWGNTTVVAADLTLRPPKTKRRR